VWLRTLQLDESTSPWDSANQLIGRTVMGRTLAEILGGRSSVIIHGMDAVLRGEIYNTMAFWTNQGLVGTYFKRHLVPFAEFMPRGVGWLSPQNQLHGSGFTYQGGREPALVTFRGVAIGSFICQEVMFADPIRQTVRAGAQLLVTTGNDGVFVDPAVAETLHAMAVIRAVEHGRYLVRSMKTGVSSVIDPMGRVVALAPHAVRTALTATVFPRSGLTLYDQFGNWLVLLCGILSALIVWRGRSRDACADATGCWPDRDLSSVHAMRAPTFKWN
jgi:apolipoprotein N-acyltransferase